MCDATNKPDQMSSAVLPCREVRIVSDIDGANVRQLTSDEALEQKPAWCADGSRIAYVCDATGNYEIWPADVEGREKRQSTQNDCLGSDPAWSPDRKHIAFTSFRTGELQVWVMAADGTAARQLTTGPGAREPTWRIIQ